jgi:Chaperone of endosialidase
MFRKALLMSTALTLGTLNPAMAGGPVVVEEEVEVVEAKPASSSGALIPLLLLVVVLAAAASGGDDEPEPTFSASDVRLKEDIRRIGTNRLGLGVYQYRYKGMDGVWEGVMAQEVEVMHPGAIRALPHGYKAVDYGKLGLEMKRVA